MIPKKFRFTSKNFGFLSRRMKSFRVKDFLFLYGQDRYHTHLAVVISKKVEKTAVKRVKYRRQMYKALREVFLPKNLKINIICLYKGKKINNNTDVMKSSVKELFDYLERKKIIDIF